MPFTDVLIKPDSPDESKIFPFTAETSDEAKKLISALCEQVKTIPDASIDYNIKCEGHFFRGHRQDTESGVFHALRLIRKSAIQFADLGIPSPLSNVLLSETLSHGGLVLVAGAKGAGKSTTLAAMVKQRLIKYGGLALTIENPIENILAGDHGEGFCLQTAVSTDIETHEAIRGAMRCFPSKQVQSILMLGEIRDETMARLALQAALDGSLVITTIHGKDVTAALRRLVLLASAKLDTGEVYPILADVMRVTIHQRYENGQHKFVALTNDGSNLSINSHIASNQIEQLSTELQRQANQIQKGVALW